MPLPQKKKTLFCADGFFFELCFLLKSSARLWYSAQLEIGWEFSRYNSTGT